MTGLTPDITAVVVVKHGVLRLTFADGATGEVSVLERMRGPVFAEARTPTGFARRLEIWPFFRGRFFPFRAPFHAE